MAALDLELAPRRPSWPRWLALAVGVALALDAGLHYLELRDGVKEIEERQSTRAERKPAEEVVPEQTRRELDSARRVLQELALPWEALFASIEGAVNRDVGLLSIEPDAGRRAVQIVGEARDYAAILRLMERLEKGRALARVHLLSHELRQDVAERPFVFTLAATWKTEEP
ncbi:hypothetical protein RA210_U110098 [Rubrivivax sp. A210]|uniref:PilN domain-containing protein n=1 Tax=Rubrivivax sp. A210 TaxID=2772301 RepID=UPI001918986E|nr:PilN domain-containing protein [Rubrivivax sp. A210]CAD5369842.1 hypothetical protein RA210_U110098 [Rubrivivax sp. A210]